MKNRFWTSTGLLFMLLWQASCGKEEKSSPTSGSSTDQIQLVTPDTHFPTLKGLAEAATGGNEASFKQILFDNPDLDVNQLLPGDDDTLLGIAIRKNDWKIFDMLLKRGADIEQVSRHKDAFEQTPLIMAVSGGHITLVKALLLKGAKVNAIDGNQDTALHVAIKKKFTPIATLLIQNRADIALADAKGKNAYNLALDSALPELIDYLHGLMAVNSDLAADANTFKTLVMMGDVTMVDKVLSRHPDLARRYESLNPLVIAMEITDDQAAFAMLNMLLGYGLNVEGLQPGETTPLIRAVKAKRLLASNLLLQKHANVSALDKIGRSPLYYAIVANHPELVQLLVDNSAETSYKTKLATGRKLTFNACTLAVNVRSEFKNAEELASNDKVRTRLGCN